MATFHESSVVVAGLKLNRMVGPVNGPPLLLLHGVLRRWQSYSPLLPHLACRWEVQGLDFPGHGGSDRLSGEYRVVDYVPATTALLRQEYSTPVILYGHSLGAMVAAAVASEAGELVRAVILEDPPLETMGSRIRQTSFHGYFSQLRRFAGSLEPPEKLAQELARIEIVDPATGSRQLLGHARDAAQLRFLASCLARLDPNVLDPIVDGRWLAQFDWRSTFSQLACPVLLLQADAAAGGMLIDAEAAEISALARRCTLVRLAGCGHNMHWTRTQDVANLTHAFLESLTP